MHRGRLAPFALTVATVMESLAVSYEHQAQAALALELKGRSAVDFRRILSHFVGPLSLDSLQLKGTGKAAADSLGEVIGSLKETLQETSRLPGVKLSIETKRLVERARDLQWLSWVASEFQRLCPLRQYANEAIVRDAIELLQCIRAELQIELGMLTGEKRRDLSRLHGEITKACQDLHANGLEG